MVPLGLPSARPMAHLPSARPMAQALRLPFEYYIYIYIIGERSEPPLSVELSEFSLYLYILENATALGSRIPPHAVLLHINNTPVKLKFIFAI